MAAAYGRRLGTRTTHGSLVRTVLRPDTREPVAGTVRTTPRNGTVRASAPQTIARPRYSVSSNGPMAFTVLSYVIAATNAPVLPTSSAHHAQRSPRRKLVTAMALHMSPNRTL